MLYAYSDAEVSRFFRLTYAEWIRGGLLLTNPLHERFQSLINLDTGVITDSSWTPADDVEIRKFVRI